MIEDDEDGLGVNGERANADCTPRKGRHLKSTCPVQNLAKTSRTALSAIQYGELETLHLPHLQARASRHTAVRVEP